jgi:hypothetical protein
MGKIPNNLISSIKSLYKRGLSAREIAEKLNYSLNEVYYFFRKHKIPRRNPTENNRLQFQKKESTFKVKKNLSRSELILKTAGIMLYWGEGSKWDGEKIVDFSNSDPRMIKLFLRFLRIICGIDESKLRCYLYCYANQNPKDLIKWWSKVTMILEDKFTKPYIRKDFKSCKSGKMSKGLIHIRYNDKKLLLLIKKWISDFK